MKKIPGAKVAADIGDSCQIFDIGWESVKMSLDRIASGALHIATIITCMLLSVPAYVCRMQLPTPVHAAVTFMHVGRITAEGDVQSHIPFTGCFVSNHIEFDPLHRPPASPNYPSRRARHER